MRLEELKDLPKLSAVYEIPRGANLLVLVREDETTDEGLQSLSEHLSNFGCVALIMVCPDVRNIRLVEIKREPKGS